MRSTATSVGRLTRVSIIAAALAIAFLSGTSADVLTSGSPAHDGGHRHGKRDRPKGYGLGRQPRPRSAGDSMPGQGRN